MGLTILSASQNFNSSKGARGGSSRWMAPELFEENPRPTYMTDVYAFGMTLYEVFRGEVPFPDLKNDFSIGTKVREGSRPTRPSTTEALYNISDGIWKIIENCWKHTPESRCAMDEVLEMVR